MSQITLKIPTTDAKPTKVMVIPARQHILLQATLADGVVNSITVEGTNVKFDKATKTITFQ